MTRWTAVEATIPVGNVLVVTPPSMPSGVEHGMSRGYLAYAERGVDSLARAIDSITGEAESTFEQEVSTAMIQRGLHPISQVGCGGFRIGLALKHPERPGEFCLGIECDGATYHSSKTARDRDRIRQNVLENLRWKRQCVEKSLNDFLQIGHLRWVGDRIADGVED